MTQIARKVGPNQEKGGRRGFLGYIQVLLKFYIVNKMSQNHRHRQ